MPSRRQVLSSSGFVVIGVLGGCMEIEAESATVDIRLLNDDTREWPLAVSVETEDKVVFETTRTVPADTGTDLGEILIEDAFEGGSGDEFTVGVALGGEQVESFNYEITCADIGDAIAPVAWGECQDYSRTDDAAIVMGETIAAAAAASAGAASYAGAGAAAGGGGGACYIISARLFGAKLSYGPRLTARYALVS